MRQLSIKAMRNELAAITAYTAKPFYILGMPKAEVEPIVATFLLVATHDAAQQRWLEST